MRYLYILYAVDAWECSEEEMEKKLARFRLEKPSQKDCTMEEFLEIGWEEHTDYSITIQPDIFGYFTDEGTAFQLAIEDAKNYTDHGCYRYGAVTKVPLNSEDAEVKNLWLFRYDKETKRGVLLERPTETKVTTAITKKLMGWAGKRGRKHVPLWEIE